MLGRDLSGMRGIDLDDLVRGGVVGWACGDTQEVLFCHCVESKLFALMRKNIQEKGVKI